MKHLCDIKSDLYVKLRACVELAVGDCPFVALRSADMTTVRRVWHVRKYGSAEGPPRGVENRNLLSHPDDLRMEAYVIRMT